MKLLFSLGRRSLWSLNLLARLFQVVHSAGEIRQTSRVVFALLSHAPASREQQDPRPERYHCCDEQVRKNFHGNLVRYRIERPQSSGAPSGGWSAIAPSRQFCWFA
jgi:hypothetical protein